MRRIVPITTAMFAKSGEVPVKVDLPHTWNALDGQDGENDYWRGIGTYTMDLPDPSGGKMQYIEFQGANHEAVVYCNGRKLGEHKGGFSTFRFDLTQAMRPSGNVLTVMVSNAPCDIYPQTADFTFFGGLYRDVSFIEVDAPHFSLLKDGTDGVFVTARSNGNTRVDLFPVNADGCIVIVRIKDQNGQVAAEGKIPAEHHTVAKLHVGSPSLWNGMANPYCYTAEAALYDGEDLMDAVTVSFGYRSFHVDPNTGFWLNGKNVPLHGVSRHQDRMDKGWAISKADHEQDIQLIKEIGANTIRLAHYQHAQYFYDLCDRTGFVLWAEIPFISRFIPGDAAYENTLSQMKELVAQNYNHPSICFWGISNEITIGGESEALYQNLADLNAMVKKLDPSRLTTMAELTLVPMDSEHVSITDVLSYNHYFGWYVGDVSDNGPWFDKFHALNPSRCLGVSEYGVEAILNWHSAFPDNHDYTEEYALYYHHEMLKTFATRPYLWSTHVWNMFDFAADDRDEGGVKGRNNKGLVTYDRKIKKDPFYLYKAYWTDEPMVHICGERFVDRAPTERNITVVTNCPSVTLIVNDVEVETKAVVDHCAVFENVALASGANTVTARAGEVFGNSIVLNGVDAHNFSYDLPEEGDAGNWFDDPAAAVARKQMEYPDGCYSVKDSIGALMSDPVTAEIVKASMVRLGNPRALHVINNSVGVSDDPMQSFYSMMRLTDMLKMGGKSVTYDFKYELNEQLIQIKKS